MSRTARGHCTWRSNLIPAGLVSDKSAPPNTSCLSGLPPAAANRWRFGPQCHPQLQPAPKSQAIPERERNFWLMASDSHRSRLQTRCDVRIASRTRPYICGMNSQIRKKKQAAVAEFRAARRPQIAESPGVTRPLPGHHHILRPNPTPCCVTSFGLCPSSFRPRQPVNTRMQKRSFHRVVPKLSGLFLVLSCFPQGIGPKTHITVRSCNHSRGNPPNPSCLVVSN